MHMPFTHTLKHTQPHIHLNTQIRAHKYTYTNTHVHTYVHTYTQIHTHTHTHTHTPIHTQTYIHTCTHKQFKCYYVLSFDLLTGNSTSHICSWTFLHAQLNLYIRNAFMIKQDLYLTHKTLTKVHMHMYVHIQKSTQVPKNYNMFMSFEIFAIVVNTSV